MSIVLVYISRLVPSLHTVGLCLGERARYRGGGQDLRPMFSPSLCLLDGRGRTVGSFLAGGGVLEVCLARLAESVFDPIRGLAQLAQTAEAFCIYLAGRFSCSVVCASDVVHPWFMLFWRRWLVRFPVSGGCYVISYGIPTVP